MRRTRLWATILLLASMSVAGLNMAYIHSPEVTMAIAVGLMTSTAVLWAARPKGPLNASH